MQQIRTDTLYAQAPAPGREAIPRRRSRIEVQPTQKHTGPIQSTHRRTISPGAAVLFIGIFLALLALWLFIQSVILPWFINLQQQVTYGNYRINEQTVKLNGVNRDTVTIGHSGRIVLIVMATEKLPLQQYVSQQFYTDGKNRVFTVRVLDANKDGIDDIVLEDGNTDEVSPVLYGKGDGSYKW